MNEVIGRVLLDLPPADVAGIALLARLQAEPPAVEELIALAPELTEAVDKLEDLSRNSRMALVRCLEISAIPSPQTPAGF